MRDERQEVTLEHTGHSISTNRLATRATVHCLTGCSIGEVLGMVLGTGFGWSNLATLAAAVALAFVFGYALTLVPLRRAGVPWLARAADTLSITLMEIVDNAIMLVIPGAMDASLSSPANLHRSPTLVAAAPARHALDLDRLQLRGQARRCSDGPPSGKCEAGRIGVMGQVLPGRSRTAAVTAVASTTAAQMPAVTTTA